MEVSGPALCDHALQSMKLDRIAPLVLCAVVACVADAPPAADAGAAASDAGSAAIDAAGSTDAAAPPVADAGIPDHWELLDPLADGIWVRVRNHCSTPLWIHAEGSSGVLAPDDRQLASGETFDYQAPRSWSAARVTAYGDGPRAAELDKAEMTLVPSGDLAVLNYNITYVDWVGLPMRLAGAGGACDASHEVACMAPRAELTTGCPAHLRDGQRCQSARSYCLNPANQSTDYCHALDGAIASCAATVPGCGAYAGATTPEAYACSGVLSEEPRLCAALNRGMLSDPDSADAAAYYVTPPYNTYAKWVHEVCPGIYAFSYDDWLSQGGFRACEGSELRITFCPAG